MIQIKADKNQEPKEESFSDEDKQLMRAHLRQRSLVLVIVAFLFYMVLLSTLIMIDSRPGDQVLTIAAHGVYFFFCWYYLHKLVSDYKKEIKVSYLFPVENKHVDTHYACHGSLAWSSPRLKEFYFTANGRQYAVEENVYQQLQPGDTVKISYAPASGLPLSKYKL